MKKAYLIISSIASLILLGNLLYWATAGSGGALGFMLGTLFIGGILILFWFPASLLSFGIALTLSKEKEKLKNSLLGFPILTVILFYAAGEYHGL